jgi:hypothetical protein
LPEAQQAEVGQPQVRLPDGARVPVRQPEVQRSEPPEVLCPEVLRPAVRRAGPPRSPAVARVPVRQPEAEPPGPSEVPPPAGQQAEGQRLVAQLPDVARVPVRQPEVQRLELLELPQPAVRVEAPRAGLRLPGLWQLAERAATAQHLPASSPEVQRSQVGYRALL